VEFRPTVGRCRRVETARPESCQQQNETRAQSRSKHKLKSNKVGFFSVALFVFILFSSLSLVVRGVRAHVVPTCRQSVKFFGS
jgi:hypothetical protein